jgi:beta-glucosidase-like glycosyl hydrolase
MRVIKEGNSTIMVGHLLLPNLDTKPATLSEKVIKKLLKGTLDYKGLILTDAMNMKALKGYSYPHATALKAGVDIILHPEDPYEIVKEIGEAYEKGLIKESQIMNAFRRVNSFRKNLKNKTKALQPLKNKDSFVHWAFKKTITVLKNEISHIKNKIFIPYLAGFYNKDIAKLFKDYFGCVFELEKFNTADSIAVVAIFTNIRAAAKEYEITNKDIELINKIISSSDTILVSFGNPYVISNLLINKAKTVVLLYDSNELAVRAFLDLFNEGLKSSGKLPIKI